MFVDESDLRRCLAVAGERDALTGDVSQLRHAEREGLRLTIGSNGFLLGSYRTNLKYTRLIY